MDLLIGIATFLATMASDLLVGWLLTLALPLAGCVLCLWSVKRVLEQPSYSNGIGRTELAFKVLTGLPIFVAGAAILCYVAVTSAG